MPFLFVIHSIEVPLHFSSIWGFLSNSTKQLALNDRLFQINSYPNIDVDLKALTPS